MITSLILYIIYLFIYALTGVFRLLPDTTLPSDLTAAISQSRGYFSSIQVIFPLSTIFTIFTIVLSIEATIFLYKGVMWIIRRVPTQS